MTLSVLLIILMMGIEVFRPQRDLRALLHQGMVGEAAAKGIQALFAATPAIVPSSATVSAGSVSEGASRSWCARNSLR